MKRIKRPYKTIRHWLLMAVFFASLSAFGQYNGTVVDAETGDALPGVVIQNGEKATTSDFNGFWTIDGKPGDVLKSSFIGYITGEVTLTLVKEVTINLKRDVQSSTLDEVVVIGFGVEKKSNVTGAITSVKAIDLEDMVLPRVETALQGRTSGVSVIQSSGAPGSGSIIRVRGVSSINGSDPLFVVDGVVIGGGIDYLNPNDIESIEVLKDAASAAIYGARGANGVVLVTTKTGAGKPGMQVTVSGYTGLQTPWRTLDVLNATEYATIQNEMAVAANQPLKYANPAALGEGTDWQSHVFNPNAVITSNDLSISGSNEGGSYYSSISYFNQDGIVAKGKSNFERLSARLNTVNSVNENITVGWNVAYSHSESQGIAENTEWGSPLGRALNIDPITPLYETDPDKLSQAPYTSGGVLRSNLVQDENGIFAISPRVTSEIVNPVAAYSLANGIGWADKIVNNTYASIKLIDGLEFKTSLGIDLAYWGSDGLNMPHYLNATNYLDTNSVYTSFNRGLTWMWDNTVSYNKTFGKHTLSALVGHSAQAVNGRYIGGSKKDIPVTDLQDATIDYARNELSEDIYGGRWERYAIESYFGRANYNYEGKYMATAILRADASSRFGQNFRWGYFPSVSAGWNIHKEDFWVSDVIDELKLKSGYGLNGSDAAGSLEFASTIVGGRNYTLGDNEVQRNGTTPAQVANPDLRWESVAQLNVGFEMRLYDNWTIGLDAYDRMTRDMKIRPPLPDYIGNDAPTANIGSLSNRGVDVEFGYDKYVSKDFNFKMSGNFSYVRNEILVLGNESGFISGSGWGPQGLEITRISEGLPIGYLFGYQTDGVFQNMNEVHSHTSSEGDTIQPGAVPGDFRFVDINEDGIINSDDRTMIGNPTPDWTAGLMIDLRYKNWDFSVFGQGIFGNDVFNATRRYDLPTSNMNVSALNRWTGEGSTNEHPRLTFDDANRNIARSSDYYVSDGSFFRVKSLQIGYNFNPVFLEKIGIEKFRLYYNGTNLLTITNYEGFDPEIGAGFGIDRGIYPQARVNSIGLRISLK